MKWTNSLRSENIQTDSYCNRWYEYVYKKRQSLIKSKKIKSKKSPGLDGVTGEFYSASNLHYKHRKRWSSSLVSRFSSVIQLRLILCDTIDCSVPGFPGMMDTITKSWNLLKLISINSVMQSNHLIFCCLLPLHLQSFPASGSFPMSHLFA